MTWEAIGAIAEVVGAGAVVVALAGLIVQMRHSTRAVEESNRLERAAALDRHSDSIGRWRERLAENEDLMRIWLGARRDEPLDETAYMRFLYVLVNYLTIQRANFLRARTAGAEGLERQAVLSVAAQVRESATLLRAWEMNRPWLELGSKDFVDAADEALAELAREAEPRYRMARPPAD